MDKKAIRYQFRILMILHELSCSDVAVILNRKVSTVRNYSAGSNPIPLKILRTLQEHLDSKDGEK